MKATGLLLFLLGATIGRTTAIQSDVKYEPSNISIREHIDQSPIPIPELGSPPYLPNFVHQGSNYFFGMPFPMSPRLLPPAPPAVETIVTEIKKEDSKDLTIVSRPEYMDIMVDEKPVFKNPVIEIGETPARKLPLPIPDVTLNLKPIPQLPSIPIPIINSQLISQLTLPLQSLVPGLPLRSNVPMLVAGPEHTSADFVVSEVDVQVKKIPPPPQLPPLVLEEVLKPIIVEEKKIILVPSPPEIQTMLVPVAVRGSKPCHPTVCAQNIVFERVLPNICEKSVELISIPASKRVPVVLTSFFPFVKK